MITAQMIGELAGRALLEEVSTTPKPGLVDVVSCGAHTDMNYFTFLASARAIEPYFISMADAGADRKSVSPETKFNDIRKIGIEAEKAMYTATGGINTHKGAIFILGILCAAAGYCAANKKEPDPRMIARYAREMCSRILIGELENITRGGATSNGGRIYLQHGIRGVRGQAIDGFPLVVAAAEMIQDGLNKGKNRNYVFIQTLLTVCVRLDDTTVINRGGIESLYSMQQCCKKVLSQGGIYADDGLRNVINLDNEFSGHGISPGGGADVLAAAIFLYSVTNLLRCKKAA